MKRTIVWLGVLLAVIVTAAPVVRLQEVWLDR